MTAILLAANAAWIGLVMALWTKRLWESSRADAGCMLLIARIRRSMRMRKDQLLGFSLKLDFGNNDTLKNAAVNIDMPRCPGVLDEETLFLQSIISTEG